MRLRLPAIKAPELPTPNHDDTRDRLLYLRSYLLMRTVIGTIGVGLPLVLLAGDGLLLAGEVPRGSLSAYYHTGMRDILVGTLYAVGVFLITYMFFHYNWDNILSIIAGTAVLGVAIFPTGGNDSLTPLQERLGESFVSSVHQVCAAVFILSLAAISFVFGQRDGKRTDRTPGLRKFRKLLHWGCALIIIGAVAYVLLTKWLGRFDAHSLFYGETIATFAFGLSWLVKGLELNILFRGELPEATAATSPDSPGAAVTA